MPYLDVPAQVLQRSFGIADADCPDAAIVVGQWSQRAYFDFVRSIWPDAREIEEHTVLIEEAGRRIWISVVIGAAMAATFAHLGAKLGATAIIQIGSFGGLADGWQVGDVLVPSLVVGRDGVSLQMSSNKPIRPDPRLSSLVSDEVTAGLGMASVRSGTLVTTTTIAFERTSDIARWKRSGYVGVEMECAATLSVAEHFGIPTAGAFALMDNLAVGHTVFTRSDDDRRRMAKAKNEIIRAAVASIIRATQ
jgi:nucleoside phosphorylase